MKNGKGMRQEKKRRRRRRRTGEGNTLILVANTKEQVGSIADWFGDHLQAYRTLDFQRLCILISVPLRVIPNWFHSILTVCRNFSLKTGETFWIA